MPILENEDLTLAREALGDQSASGENAFAEMAKALKLAKSAIDSANAESERAELALSRAQEELEAANDEKDRALSLSRNTVTAKPTASELYFASKAVAAAKTRAIASKAITPAIATKAESRMVSKAVDFGTLSLSRDVEEDDHKLMLGLSRLLDFYETVEGNDPVLETGEISGAQVLGRATPGFVPDKQAEADKAAEAEAKQWQDERLASMGHTVTV